MKQEGKVTKAAQELKRATGRGSNVSMVEVAEHFFQQVGGAREFAKLLYDELKATKPGGMIRARILDIVMQAVKFVNTKEPPIDELSTLNDDDLERELTLVTLKVTREEKAPDRTDDPGSRTSGRLDPDGVGLAPGPVQEVSGVGVGPASGDQGQGILPGDAEPGEEDRGPPEEG